MNVDRELLQDIGFVRGTGWDHEVWVYEGMFWLHYGSYDRERYLSLDTALDGDGLDRKQFFKKFLKAIADEIHESMIVYEEPY